MLPREEELPPISHPKTPRPRQPLARMVEKSLQKNDRQSNTQNQRQKEESDHSSDEDSDNSDYDDGVDSAVPPEDVRSSKKSTSPAPVSKRLSSSQDSTHSHGGKENITQSPRQRSQSSKSSGKEEHKRPTIIYNVAFGIAAIMGIAAIIAVPFFYFVKADSMEDVAQPSLSDEEAIKNFEESIDDISSKFTKQHSDIWNEICSGVVDIVRHPAKRSVIFLFSKHDDPMYCLARMLGNATKAALQTDENLWLAPSDFVNNYGEVLEKFRKSIEKQRIVIIENILDINPEAMRAFHNFCDSENPLVSRTIYIITMIVKNYRGNEQPHVFVEEQLRRKLEGKINPDKLQPLIARLTDAAIIPVQPEPDITSCPLRY